MRALVPALAMVAAPVMAQTPAPSAEATAAATALVDLMTPPAQAQAGVSAQIGAIRDGQMVRAMIGASPGGRAELAKNTPAMNAAIGRMGAIQANALGPIFTEMQAAQRRASIAAHARQFTVAELQALATFFRSPAGAKYVRTQPRINAEVGQQIQQQFAPRIQAAQKQVAPQLEAEMRKLFPQAGQGKAK
jgi:hypothetical protein